MTRARTFHEPVVLMPGPASFHSPELKAAIERARALTAAADRPQTMSSEIASKEEPRTT